MQPYLTLPPDLWFPLDWTVVAVITPRGTPDGGRRVNNSLLSPAPPPIYVPAHPAAPLLRGFWHPRELPRCRISKHETHSRPCTPTIGPWMTPALAVPLSCPRPDPDVDTKSCLSPPLGFVSPPWATILVCTFGISTLADHVKESLCHPAHVCVVYGPAAAYPRNRRNPRIGVLLCETSIMFPGTYA